MRAYKNSLKKGDYYINKGETAELRHIWITVMYEGTSFAGFQRQTNGLTVQEVLETAVERLTREKATIYFVARTDAGVHAWAQECTFYTESSIPGERFQHAMNAFLPPSVRVRQSREMDKDFSVRRQNTGKTYGYILSQRREESPFLGRYAWACGEKLDVEKMRAAAASLIGRHDFTSFRGSNAVPSDPERTIYDIRIVPDREMIRLYVTGDGFLYHMVRNIAGAMADAGAGRLCADDITAILSARDRRRLGVTAPAQGLCLLRVYFQPITEEAIGETLRAPLYPWNP